VSAYEQMEFNANDMFMSLLDQRSWEPFPQRAAQASKTGSVLGYGSEPAIATTAAAIALARLNAPAAPTPDPYRTRMWLSVFGGRGYAGGDAQMGSYDTEYSGSGLAAGLEYAVTPNTVLGFALGTGDAAFNSSDVDMTHGSAEGNRHVALYGWTRNGNLYGTGALAAGFYDTKTTRQIDVPDIILSLPGGDYVVPGANQTEYGSFASRSLSAKFEVGYDTRLGGLTVSPFAGIELTALQADSYSETSSGGPSTYGLSFEKQTTYSIPSTLGLQVGSAWVAPNGVDFSNSLRADWLHEFEPGRSTTASILAAPGYDFTVQGAQPATDAAELTLKSQIRFAPHAAIYGKANATISDLKPTYSGNIGVKVSW